MRGLMIVSTALTAALVLFLLGYVLINGIPGITWELVSTKPSYLSGTIGILPDILNTLYIVLATLVIVLPLGVGAAIYLTEYAKNKKLWRRSNMPQKPFRAFPRLYTAWWACCSFQTTSERACLQAL